ncbi:MAG: hypothetical protein U0324_02550 [Polyangiales bacterium]
MNLHAARLAALSLLAAACAPVDDDRAATSTAAATACTTVALECNVTRYRTTGGGSTPVPPTYEATPLDLVQRACTTSFDCGVAYLPLNNCGAYRAYGVNRASLSTFSLSVNYCLAQYVACSPYAYSVVAEDGRYAPKSGAVSVQCCAGRCATTAASTL